MLRSFWIKVVTETGFNSSQTANKFSVNRMKEYEVYVSSHNLAPMNLHPGDAAPNFTAHNQQGESVSLSDFRGKKVVIYFYPKDDTPGCTAQACNLRDNYSELQQAGYEVIGISGDGVKSHDKFASKYELPFTLLADEDKAINEAYGVWKEKSMYGRTYLGTARTTFVIDEEGIITDVIEKVKTNDHTAQILNS